jgi:type VII secretion-associated serine protease mycosin
MALRPQSYGSGPRLVRSRRAITRLAVVGLIAATAPILGPASSASAASDCGPSKLPKVTVTDVPWGQQRLNAPAVWPLTRGAGVTVAVIDSGVSKAPAVLAGGAKFASGGKDFTVTKGGGDPYCDSAEHGTVVAAIIAGHDGTGLFSGIAPDAKILSLRAVPQENGNNDLGPDVSAAIRYAIRQKVKVINLSISSPDIPQLRSAVEDAIAANIVVVAAAGNENIGAQDGPSYPAAYPGVLAVAGVDENGNRVSTSVAGSYVDVAAPGVDIIGPNNSGGSYVALANGGTSFAAAYVSGVVALLLSHEPSLTPADVVDRLTRTADRPPGGRNNDLGYGVVNPYRAIATITSTNHSSAAIPPLPPAHVSTDPLAAQKRISLWAALGGLVLAAVLLIGRPVLRAGRRRRWRAG